MTEVVVCPPEVCHFVEAVVWKKTGLAFVMPAALKCSLTPEVLEMEKDYARPSIQYMKK